LNVELGAKYHNKYKDDENSEFAGLCKDITAAYEKIAAKEKEIEELKINTGTKNEDCTSTQPEQECSSDCCSENQENNEG